MPDRRGTRQRQAIRRAFERAAGPLSPREVHDVAGAEVEGLGLATVYRALRRLEEEGFIEPVPVPGEGVRYERAGRNHHHHFHCEACDRIFDLDACRLPPDLGLSTPPGFLPKRHEVIVHGRCPDCRRKRDAG